jgi:transcriptional regulator with XRE-family HTH domain
MARRYTIAAKKAPNLTDEYVGARVRMRRKLLAMSQTQLADALGITYQQLQKNERGTNRIAASRLQQISHILQVPVAFFFEGAPNASAPEAALANCRARINQINARLSEEKSLVNVSSAAELLFYLEFAASVLKKSAPRPQKHGRIDRWR